jgi:hypothetical protein
MKLKILGTTQDVTTCECCGLRNLKKTVELGVIDADGNFGGEVLHYGVDCAATALGYSKRGGKTQVENKVLNLVAEFKAVKANNAGLSQLVNMYYARKRAGLASLWIESKIVAYGFKMETVHAAYGK